EGQLVVSNAVRVRDVLLLEVYQELLVVEEWIPIVAIIGGPAALVGRRGKHLPHAHHLALLSSIRPHRTLTSRASRRRLRSDLQLAVGAIVAESPELHIRHAEIDLVDGYVAPLSIELVGRRQLGERTNGRTLVLEDPRLESAL